MGGATPRGRGGRGRTRTSESHIKAERTDREDEMPRGDGGGFNHDDGTFNAHLPERFGGATFQRNTTSTDNMRNHGYCVELNTGPREYAQSQEKVGKSNLGTWQSLPDVPTSEEISPTDNQALMIPANKVKGKWKSKEKYLRCHYELLREDSIAPIREAVDAVRKDPNMMDNKAVAIYEKVHIRGFTFTRAGVAARITFSTARAVCKINWQSSSRLVSGSILAMTPVKDNFMSKCVVAIVAARPQAGVDCIPPEIDIYFSNPEDVDVDPQTEWLMVEAKSGFYESLRHTMRALQKLSGEAFPLHQRICSLDNNLNPPAYVEYNADLDLSATLPDIGKKPAPTRVNVLNNWPSDEQGYLDNTQWEAMKQILTKDLSIIQGPPGTGKTFVSKVALQILVENRVQGDPPIIVAAQTNHALDQLLSHISKFDSEYIRLGGRSKVEEVKRRALFEIRQANKLPPIPGSLYGVSGKRLEKETQLLREILEPLSPRQAHSPFSAADLFRLGVISQEQADSLIAGADQWVTASAEPTNETMVWLGRALQPWNLVYTEDILGNDEAEDDLEFEQLREHEAETGQTDQEDVELLRGFWCAIERQCTVDAPGPAVLADAKRDLDLKQDLWKIPSKLRGPAYFVMQEKAMTAISVRFRDHVKDYDRICKELKTGIFERDAVYLSKANIIGLTTTGLSKYRPLIASMKPKIVLIEEAAEVIEAPVTAACFESLEHLILVGDHKQLQGHCTVDELGRSPYNLNVSMFERLVNNGIPYKTLLRQRRMEPEFRELIGSIYPELEDHPNIMTRSPLPPHGMGNVKCYFLEHNWSEMRDAQMSLYNDKEAEFIAGFYAYLMMNRVHPSKITILTFYNGQRKRILKYIRDRPLCKEEYHNVKTVDGYQGEENEIIILSLVRSNDKNIGFLSNENRVCVAMSRAKRGFYIFGNSFALARNSELWDKIFRTLKGQIPSRVGNTFPLQCDKHGRTTAMEFPEDWSEHRAGCDIPCGESLSCGHACKLTCHPFDHSMLNCLIPCQKELPCGHICKKKCFESCYCGCASTGTDGDEKSDKPGDDSGRRGLWDNRPPDRSDNQERAWGDGLNDGWGAPDNTTNGNDWGGEAGGTDWNSGWGQPPTVNKQNCPRRHPGQRQQSRGPTQVLRGLPIRSAEEQAARDGGKNRLHDQKPAPAESYGQRSHSSRPSTASSNVPATLKYESGHSPAKQMQQTSKWAHFAQGGVKRDDEERARARQEQWMASREEQRNSDRSTASDAGGKSPGAKEVITTIRKDGKKIFTEMYRPARRRGPVVPSPEKKETKSPKVPHDRKELDGKSYELREPSLLD